MSGGIRVAPHSGVANGDYAERARRALVENILPFWQRTLDKQHGGVFNCWNNAGTQLVSRDKFTWSQGRFVWLWSRLHELAQRGAIPATPENAFLEHAERTVRFLEAHAFLADGRCAFLLSETGAVKEAVPGRGPAPSIYADCFVVMGLAEFARVSGDRTRLDRAWELFENLERRIAAGGFPTHPTTLPEGYEAYAVTMIRLNVALVLGEASERLHDPRGDRARAGAKAAAGRLFDRFMMPDGAMLELRPHGVHSDPASFLERHVNPGHSLEGLWMLLTVAQREQLSDWLERAHGAVRWALERGWDQAHGGILYYLDREGGGPAGVPGDSVYEKGIRASWDTKLWWVHSESLYAAALSHRLSCDETMRAWFERVWDYAFRVFPNPDASVGEWIQIRDRRGVPLERVVALPVKDPYHVARNLIQVLELNSL